MTKLHCLSVTKNVCDATAIEYCLISALIGLAAMIFFLAPVALICFATCQVRVVG